ncbi:MAG: hypothetical protein K2H97_06930 [Prevotella sp.]|nr:hypothetical protein [Prevotella sp.]
MLSGHKPHHLSVLQASKRNDLYTIRASICHLSTGDDKHQIRFTKFELNERISAIVKMKDDIAATAMDGSTNSHLGPFSDMSVAISVLLFLQFLL